MRTLSRAECVVLRSLLAAGLESERDRERSSGLARTTYQDAKRRLYADGWLEDRYVPEPQALGISAVRFQLVRPFAESMVPLARAWQEDPGAVVLWSGGQSLFGVFFDREPATSRASSPGAGPGRSFSMSVPSHDYGLPVYFDFEGAIAARGRGRPAPHVERSGYPRGLGGPRPVGRRAVPPSSPPPPGVEVASLLRHPFGAGSSRRPPHRFGPTSLPRSQRRLLARGWVQWRRMLRPDHLPAFEGRTIHGIVLVAGVLRQGARPVTLFRDLVGRAGVHPFLYATDGDRVLLASLQARDRAPRPDHPAPAPAPAAAEVAAASLEVLGAHLTSIDIVREPAETLHVLLDHRYDRLAPGSASGARWSWPVPQPDPVLSGVRGAPTGGGGKPPP